MRKDRVLEILQEGAPAGAPQGLTADEVARRAGIQRHNASADLNELCRDGSATKDRGRPVQFWATAASGPSRPNQTHTDPPRTDPPPHPKATDTDLDDQLIGGKGSLRSAIEQAKAAMLYPPRGLPTLIVGPTGTGKSRLAEAMYGYARRAGRLGPTAAFQVFNCADYAANPQLLLAQLFGYVKGAFTGADRDTPGLIAKTDHGVLFLDEIHRLPPDGQEMLFLLMDRGVYRPLGDSSFQQAAITLIAATTEEPRSALLGTFLRRFPVVMTLPDLDERPMDERLALVELFLREEAARVGVPMKVSPLALVALLTFRTTGNVGELRSAVLLGCAKAFLHYMAEGGAGPHMGLYLTHLAPQIQLAFLGGCSEAPDAERLVGVEDRIYAPADGLAGKTRDDYVSPDLYQELRRRMGGYVDSGLHPGGLQRLIQTDLDYYLRRLMRRPGALQHIPKGLLDVVGEFVRVAGAELGRHFEPEVVTGLALHFASRTGSEPQEVEGAMALMPNCPREYGVVRRLSPHLEAGLGVTLTPGELTFLTLFLAAHGRAEPAGSRVLVMVIAHGEQTASSMADVANRLLGGEPRVMGVDMPLEQSVDSTLDRAVAAVRAAGDIQGVALLVDMGSLTGFGPAIAQATGVPVSVWPLVTTPAVIEAARVAGEPEADLGQVTEAVRKIYHPESETPLRTTGKRMIITTCLTGQGTARKLAAFLREALPAPLRDTVDIQPVDLQQGSPLPGLLLDGWRGSVIAAAGTVDPHLPGVAFIGMEQILFGEGLHRLIALASGSGAAPAEEPPLGHDEAVALARQFVAENMAADGGRAADSAIQALRRLEEWREQSSSPGQAARWVIHFAFALERLATGGPVLTCGELPYLQEHHGGLLDLISEAVAPEAAAWAVTVDPPEIGFLALILLSA